MTVATLKEEEDCAAYSMDPVPSLWILSEFEKDNH